MNGDYYEGEFEANKKNGYGEFYTGQGVSYKGWWRDGFYEGEGILEVPGISKYEGNFVKGIK